MLVEELAFWGYIARRYVEQILLTLGHYCTQETNQQKINAHVLTASSLEY